MSDLEEENEDCDDKEYQPEIDDDDSIDEKSNIKSQFDVHEHFIVDGKTIIGGVVSKGKIKKGEK